MKRIATYTLGLIVLITAGLVVWVFWDLPNPRQIEDRQVVPGIRFVDRHGQLLYETIDPNAGRHIRLTGEQIPEVVRQATIATEDRNFYNHPGVDLVGIARALWINARGGEVLAGGSTITQQLARTMLLEDERFERTVKRKLRESWLAWRLSRLYTKDQILELYLNQTYYGGMAYGIEAAAQTFFGRSAAKLTTAQAALLAGLPQTPAFYNPFLDPDAAKARQEVVLGLMHQEGWLTAAEYELAQREPLSYASTPYPIEAPHFVTMAQAELDQLFDLSDQQQAGGLIVRTTLDLTWQKKAEFIVSEQIEQLKNPPDGGFSHRVDNGALVAIHPDSGDVLTLVGSADFFSEDISGSINMTLAPRQPGSTLKPLIYAAAMDPARIRPYTAATMLLDVETVFTTKEGESYIPVNFSRTEHGPVLVREALASSLNIPAVLTLDHIGVQSGLDLMQDMGLTPFEAQEEVDLSIALGGGAVRLIDLTRAYAVFANGGERISPRLILEVTTIGGDQLYSAAETDRVQVLDNRLAWLISDMLADNQARQRTFGAHSLLNIGRPAAVKTGTTNDFHDNWTVGYTPDLVVGVWVGNADNSPMVNITGLSGAGPIWHRFMRAVLNGTPPRPFERPPGLVEAEVCTLSGLLPTDDCPFRRLEWFIEGTTPVTTDTVYRRVAIDQVTGTMAQPETPSNRVVLKTVLDLPPAAHGWARQEGLLLYHDVVFVPQQGNAAPDSEPLAWRSPTPNATYILSPELPETAQRVAFEIDSGIAIAEVKFWLNGEIVGVVDQQPFRMVWPLAVGDYVLWAEAITVSGESRPLNTMHFAVKLPEN